MVDKPEDDTAIKDEEGLLRRVPNWPNMCKLDKNLNVYRPSSACFSDPATNDSEVSITLEQSLISSGGKVDDAIAGHPEFGLVRVIAGFVRKGLNFNQIIAKSPTDADPHHGLIIGKKNRATKKGLAKNSVVIINPKMKE